MKKDFLLATILSLVLLGLSFTHWSRTVVALRHFVFYLIYPTSSSLTSALEHASGLRHSWAELLSSKEQLDRLRVVIKREESERLFRGMAQQESQDREHFKFLENLGTSWLSRYNRDPDIVGKTKDFSLTFYRVGYRSPSALGWVSRACLTSTAPVLEGLPVVAYSLRYGGFAFLGKTLPRAEGFGDLSCLEMLTSAKFSLLVQGKDSREEALLRGLGEPNRLLLDYLVKESSMAIGETLITSNASLLAPGGIAVGRLIGFEGQASGALFKKAYVEPYLELGKIQEVAVLDWPSRLAR